jgi:carbon monoxide dehydrogenase subunit G
VQIENSFQVPAGMEEAWALFTDVQRIAPCMPGAEITEDLGDGRYRGQASVRLGPMTMRFAGEAQFLERDEASRTVRLSASGRDQTGRGTARAVVTSRLLPADGSTRVELVTDLQLSGALAQFGRQGIVSDVSSALIGQFASCLHQRLVGDRAAVAAPGEAPAPSAPAATPSPSVLVLLRQILVGVVRRWRERLRGRLKPSARDPKG